MRLQPLRPLTPRAALGTRSSSSREGVGAASRGARARVLSTRSRMLATPPTFDPKEVLGGGLRASFSVLGRGPSVLVPFCLCVFVVFCFTLVLLLLGGEGGERGETPVCFLLGPVYTSASQNGALPLSWIF